MVRSTRAAWPRMEPEEDTTLEEATAWLSAHLRKGAICPCCKQVANVYKRGLEGAMTSFLIRAYRVHGTDWFHVPTFMQVDARARKACGVGGTYSKLAYWGLLEEATERREDGGRAGWWRVTLKGVDFVEQRITVPRYILLYNGNFIRYEGEDFGLLASLGKKFNFEEMMAA